MNTCSLKISLNFFISDTSMILLQFSTVKRNATSFFKNSTLCNHPWFLLTTKKLIIYYHFFIIWSINLTKSFLSQFIENRHSRDSTRAGIHLDQRRGRRISLAVSFTELLKFALRKSFHVKSAKAKISYDRMVIQKKSLFRELKRFQTFKP